RDRGTGDVEAVDVASAARVVASLAVTLWYVTRAGWCGRGGTARCPCPPYPDQHWLSCADKVRGSSCRLLRRAARQGRDLSRRVEEESERQFVMLRRSIRRREH